MSYFWKLKNIVIHKGQGRNHNRNVKILEQNDKTNTFQNLEKAKVSSEI